jgi:hypothetical protein
MRTSILQVVTPDLAGVASGYDASDVSRLTSVAERMTLLSRPGRGSRGQRFHPLVREFLEARLRSTMSDADVAGLHLRVADCRQRARLADGRLSLPGSRRARLGRERRSRQPFPRSSAAAARRRGRSDRPNSDQCSSALDWPCRLAGADATASRRDAIALTHSVLEQADPGTPESDLALLNLASLYIYKGVTDESLPVAQLLGDTTTNDQLRLIARGTSLVIEASRAGDLNLLRDHLQGMAEAQRDRYPHFFGVTMLNLAVVAIIQDDPGTASQLATEAGRRS